MKDEEDKDYIPTQDEIRLACDKIQKSWSNNRKKSRLTIEQDELSVRVIDTSSLSHQLRNISE